MADPAQVFAAEEFQGRVARLQQEMDSRGLDALFLTAAADIFYVTGFLTRFWESPARPWFLVVPAVGMPVAVIPAIGAEPMRRTWIEAVRTWNAPDPADDGLGLLVDTLAGLTPETARIGVPMGLETHLRMPLADYRTVARRIAPREFVDGTDALQRVREIKSEAEVDAIRTTCAIAGRSFARVGEIAGRGRPLDSVVREFQALLLQEGADWVSYVAAAAGPGGYRDVISPASTAALGDGDVLMLDTGAVRQGYFGDFNRNFTIGPASGDVRRTQDALWQATEDALAALRPGMLARDAHRLMSDALARQGAQPGVGRMGHGLGVTLTEWPSFTALDATPLRDGMVLTLEPCALLGSGRMLVHEENVVLRSGGAELLSPRAPRIMPELA